MIHGNFIYRSNFRRQGVQHNIYYWECINNRKGRCRGRLKTIGDKLYIANSNGKLVDGKNLPLFGLNCIKISVPHNHDPEEDRIEEARSKGQLSKKSLGEAATEYDEKASLKIEMILEESSV